MLYFSRWRTLLIWAIVAVGVVAVLPNLLSDRRLAAVQSVVPVNRMALGLDLQGGSLITLKIEREDIVKLRLETTASEVAARLRQAGIAYSGLSGVGQSLEVRISDPNQLVDARQALKSLSDPRNNANGDGTHQDASLADTPDGRVTLAISNQSIDYYVNDALAKAMDVVRRRVAEVGNFLPVIKRQGYDRIIVQVPGLPDSQRLKSLLGQAGNVSFRLIDASMPVQDAINGAPPASSEVLYSMDDPPVGALLEKRVLLADRDIVAAEAQVDAESGDSLVGYRLTTDAARRFADETQKAIGRTLAVVVDDQILSTSVIAAAVTGESGRILGNFSVEGANDLAALLRAGSLPATLTVVEERSIDSSLGADSITHGLIAGAIAAVAIVIFMVGFYGTLGIIAIVALVANVVMILGILSLFGATLTLPGIAGIILTIGMAVDSNVLIYERVREEVRNGRPFVEALSIGFSRAFSTIVDANLTMLIAALVLFYMGSGPVRGFAVTLTIGIITTVFTAFSLTRWLVAYWVRKRQPKTLPKDVRTGIFDGTNIRFMAIRRYTFIGSAVLAIAALAGFMTSGVNYGIDFTGGSLIEVQTRQGDADLEEIRTRLSELNIGEVDAKTIGNAQTVRIRVHAQDGGENAEQSAITLIRAELEDAYEFRRVEVVGPSISGELTTMASLGVLGAIGAILIYIAIRFEWRFALGAIVATLHDVILTIGLFVLTGVEFNLTSIAALLTIVGYSLNDTVVVYDRMRENLRRYPQMPLPLLIDASINQTLSRTILTSATTMIAMAALFLFGGDVIRSFAFAMFFGIAAGTFSSIYMAAPVLIAFRLRPERFKNKRRQKGDDLPTGTASTE